MSGPQRLDVGGPGAPRPSSCLGALVQVTRESYRELERAGVRWSTRSDEVPYDRPISARVSCEGEELVLERATGTVRYGLCSSCAFMETEARRTLRERQSIRRSA